MKKIRARILSMTKDDMKFCSARVIWACLEDVENGQKYHVAWAQSPGVIGVTGTWRSRAQDAFSVAWEKCEVDDVVWLYHPTDSNFNYFEPMNETEAA